MRAYISLWESQPRAVPSVRLFGRQAKVKEERKGKGGKRFDKEEKDELIAAAAAAPDFGLFLPFFSPLD